MSRSQRARRIAWFVGLGLLVASVATSRWALHLHGAAVPAPAATTESTDRREPSFVCFGYVDVEQGVTSLYPAQPGRVQEIRVQENQPVKAGAVLLTLDKRLADCLVRQARAEYEAARVQREQAGKLIEQQKIKEAEQQAAIEAAWNHLQAAQAMLARREELRAIQGSERELEAARAQVAEVKAAWQGETKKLDELKLNDPREAIRRADAKVLARQARLDQALLGWDECTLKAPADGTVLRILTGPGEMLGSQPRQPALLFCPAQPRIIRAEVEQEWASRLALEQPALIHDDSSAGPAWHGKVLRISDWYTHRRSMLQEPLQLNDVRTLECIIAVDAADQPHVRIGQRVRVTIGGT